MRWRAPPARPLSEACQRSGLAKYLPGRAAPLQRQTLDVGDQGVAIDGKGWANMVEIEGLSFHLVDGRRVLDLHRVFTQDLARTLRGGNAASLDGEIPRVRS
jgi:hypothetical protein